MSDDGTHEIRATWLRVRAEKMADAYDELKREVEAAIDAGMTQRQIANASGLAVATVNKWSQDHRKPRASTGK